MEREYQAGEGAAVAFSLMQETSKRTSLGMLGQIDTPSINIQNWILANRNVFICFTIITQHTNWQGKYPHRDGKRGLWVGMKWHLRFSCGARLDRGRPLIDTSCCRSTTPSSIVFVALVLPRCLPVPLGGWFGCVNILRNRCPCRCQPLQPAPPSPPPTGESKLNYMIPWNNFIYADLLAVQKSSRSKAFGIPYTALTKIEVAGDNKISCAMMIFV